MLGNSQYHSVLSHSALVATMLLNRKSVFMSEKTLTGSLCVPLPDLAPTINILYEYGILVKIIE